MSSDQPALSAAELKRVGSAATMLVVCGTVVIVTMTILLGHYNSLAHSGPKAAVDGAVIAMLMRGGQRWRCLALLGVVYGFVLLFQVGLFYLLPITAIAGAAAALVGRTADLADRRIAVVLAAIIYELLAGFGAPIKIYFGTGGQREPFLWALWFAEWPLRIVGAGIGVWLVGRRREMASAPKIPTSADIDIPRSSRTPSRIPAGFSLVACFIACVAPMAIESTPILAAIAFAYLLYAFAAGVRRPLLHGLLGLIWGWIIYGFFSYAWNHDFHRVLDLGRTLVLRFAPMTFAAMVIVTATRPIELFRLMRRLRINPIVLIPLSAVLRNIPQIRISIRRSTRFLRTQGHWTGPRSLLRNPVAILRTLLAPHLGRWNQELSERASATEAPDRPI